MMGYISGYGGTEVLLMFAGGAGVASKVGKAGKLAELGSGLEKSANLGKVMEKLKKLHPDELADKLGKRLEKIRERAKAKDPKPKPGDKAPEPHAKPAEEKPKADDPKKDQVQQEQDGQPNRTCILENGVGCPVNPLQGAKFLADALDLDFELPAPLAMPWQRSYVSNDDRIGPLGLGWSIPASPQLEPRRDRTVFIDGLGRRITFPALPPGGAFYSQYEHCWLRRGPEPEEGQTTPRRGPVPWDSASYAIEFETGDALLFRPPLSLGDPLRFTPWPLRAQLDRNDYAIQYQYDVDNRLQVVGG
mgnify:CR=1 FL=1